ncbi:unnamed protein product [Cyclocybe aegerita]|uniref:Uncharacterized protein n=1 Tax=Cyclocybe aegerita TaxID=1973307 RepID=A0A8S0XK77_CYCAE|nr:unnamed protein product [Cyclocybe aegerita]
MTSKIPVVADTGLTRLMRSRPETSIMKAAAARVKQKGPTSSSPGLISSIRGPLWAFDCMRKVICAEHDGRSSSGDLAEPMKLVPEALEIWRMKRKAQLAAMLPSSQHQQLDNHIQCISNVTLGADPPGAIEQPKDDTLELATSAKYAVDIV